MTAKPLLLALGLLTLAACNKPAAQSEATAPAAPAPINEPAAPPTDAVPATERKTVEQPTLKAKAL
ncbi:MAG: TlpA family protein disulfide reductase, partial [Gammaproteobacteria bacterium]|nr:TlpA family protein disulfide reductase [Gammaproteobacteria bacterium]